MLLVVQTYSSHHVNDDNDLYPTILKFIFILAQLIKGKVNGGVE